MVVWIDPCDPLGNIAPVTGYGGNTVLDECLEGRRIVLFGWEEENAIASTVKKPNGRPVGRPIRVRAQHRQHIVVVFERSLTDSCIYLGVEFVFSKQRIVMCDCEDASFPHPVLKCGAHRKVAQFFDCSQYLRTLGRTDPPFLTQ